MSFFGLYNMKDIVLHLQPENRMIKFNVESINETTCSSNCSFEVTVVLISHDSQVLS